MKGFVFFDIDNTIYDGYVTSDFSLFLADISVFPPRIYEEEHSIVKAFQEGKINYAESGHRAIELMAKYLKGQTLTTLAIYQKKFLQTRVHLFPWVEEVFELFRKAGLEPVLVSAAAEPAVSPIANKLGVSSCYTSKIISENSIFTGECGRIINYEEKRKVVLHHTKYYPKVLKIGFGDSEGDLAMLMAMDEAFLYCPRDPALIWQAERYGFFIVNEGSIYNSIEQVLAKRRTNVHPETH
jgi:HAD superfamily phosphoserine phosphatase-like hydrolase